MPATAWPRPSAVDSAWVGLAIACLAIMVAWPSWETIPFHVIWISLTLLYGFRVWSPRVTGVVLGFVVLATGTSIFLDAFDGLQLWGELFEVPLMSAMFLAMVWHARRRAQMLRTVEALAEERAMLLEHDERLMQNISHELRTPVTIARGHLDLLARRLGTEPAELTIATEELTRMELLIDRILLLARAERSGALDREYIALVGFLEDLLVRWAGAAPRAWRLGPVLDVTLAADPTWLRAAIDALIENAVQHTDEYGRIEIGAYGDGDNVVITVEDDGHGVPPELHEQIFERFARPDSSRSRREGGAGLGLSIVSAIARSHGGSTRALANPDGRGTIFELRLPLARAEAAEREEEAGPPFPAEAVVGTQS